jgi:hypothetical protein
MGRSDGLGFSSDSDDSGLVESCNKPCKVKKCRQKVLTSPPEISKVITGGGKCKIPTFQRVCIPRNDECNPRKVRVCLPKNCGKKKCGQIIVNKRCNDDGIVQVSTKVDNCGNRKRVFKQNGCSDRLEERAHKEEIVRYRRKEYRKPCETVSCDREYLQRYESDKSDDEGWFPVGGRNCGRSSRLPTRSCEKKKKCEKKRECCKKTCEKSCFKRDKSSCNWRSNNNRRRNESDSDSDQEIVFNNSNTSHTSESDNGFLDSDDSDDSDDCGRSVSCDY